MRGGEGAEDIYVYVCLYYIYMICIYKCIYIYIHIHALRKKSILVCQVLPAAAKVLRVVVAFIKAEKERPRGKEVRSCIVV